MQGHRLCLEQLIVSCFEPYVSTLQYAWYLFGRGHGGRAADRPGRLAGTHLGVSLF